MGTIRMQPPCVQNLDPYLLAKIAVSEGVRSANLEDAQVNDNFEGSESLIHPQEDDHPNVVEISACFKWVFKIKYKSDGKIERYKAKLVAKGYNQRKGIYFDETFSLVAKIVVVSLLDVVGITAALFYVNTALMKLQKLVSQLELLDEKLSQENVNQKLLRSLSPEWNIHAVVWRNKADLDTMSMDDLYNNLKVYEPEVKGMSSSSSSTQNMAFVSSSNNNTSSTNEAVKTAHGVSTASTQVNAANIDNLSDVVICAFFTSQPNSPQLVHEDLQQIHPDDIEEMDLRCSDSNVSNDSTCLKSCLETVKLIKSQNDQLLKDLKKFELMVLGEITIRELRKKLEIAQKEKDGIQLNVDKFEHASKSLNKLIECQIVDNCKKDEFVNNHVVENCKALSSKEEPKVVRKNDDAPIIKEWVSGDEEEDVSQPKIEKKIVRPNYEEIDGGYVAFGGNLKGGKITRKCTIKIVPRKNNMYSVDLKNIVPKGGLTCLFAKATSDESKLWHKRLGHLNFKTMNKLVKGNLVRGLPSKLLKMTQTCVACKGKAAQSSSRTPQQNRVAERRNRTLIEAARTMLANSKLPTTFLVEAVNTACYVQNRVLVVKPYKKTLYELFHGRTPTLSFMRPFRYPITILNTIDHLGKFDGKADEGFFVGYSLNSKAFRVFNSRTRIVEENLHIRFSESTPNVVGSGPDWLFDIDALTRTMNYEPIVAGTQSNGFAGTKASDNAGQARKETEPIKDYILLPLWTADPPFSQDPKSSHDDGSKPSSDDEKKVDEDPRKDSEYKDPKKEDNVNSTHNFNIVSLTVNAAGTNEVNVVGGKTSIELPFDLDMPALKDDSIFDFSRDDEDDNVVADMNNLDTSIQVSPIPTTRIDKDQPLDQVIRDLQSATQTRKISKNLEEHGFVSTIQQRTNHKDLQNCLFAFFITRTTQKGTKWVFRNKKDEREIVIRNKARSVAQRHIQEEGTNYDEVFAPVARIEVIRLFLAYASFKDFVVYQMDVKSVFLYGKIEEEVYVCQPPRFEDPDFPDRVYKVEKALYGLHQAPRSWYETLSTYLLDNGFQRGKTDKTLFIKMYKGDILLVQVYVDDIIFGSTKKELCIAFEKLMHEKFQMSSMGELTFFLGLQVKQKKDGIFISQDKYVDEILKKFGFTEVKTASTPMET
ncbi:retrovirus-related pol polyprotein from transposon TNT 1-94 [Tanacetum coccineum]